MGFYFHRILLIRKRDKIIGVDRVALVGALPRGRLRLSGRSQWDEAPCPSRPSRWFWSSWSYLLVVGIGCGPQFASLTYVFTVGL
jgi:hypothetical protein